MSVQIIKNIKIYFDAIKHCRMQLKKIKWFAKINFQGQFPLIEDLAFK